MRLFIQILKKEDMSANARRIEQYVKVKNPVQITGFDEQKIKEVVGAISFRQGQVW